MNSGKALEARTYSRNHTRKSPIETGKATRSHGVSIPVLIYSGLPSIINVMELRYGYLQESEFDLIDKVLGKLKVEFGSVQYLEVGIGVGGLTSHGVVRRCNEIGVPITASGVDVSTQPPRPLPLPDYKYYEGDSMEVWRNVEGTFNFLFVDGCHCAMHAMCDFLNYSPMLVAGGYVLFHDTARSGMEDEQTFFVQDHSYIKKPDSVLGVRHGLKKLGLLQGYRADWEFVEEIPTTNGLMGMICYRKLKDL